VDLRELWRITRIVFKEVSFQSIFSLRMGSALPQRGRTSIDQLVRNAQMNILISKLLTTLFVAAFGFAVFVPMMGLSTPANQSRDVMIAGAITAFLASVLFLIVVLGLQVSTSFISSKISDVLSPLPLSKQDVSKIVFLCFVRIFDIPLIAGIVVLLTVYFLVGGSLLGGLVSLVAVVVTEIFAITLTIGLARFFYSRVAGGGGRSKLKILLRLVFMLVWILPTVGTYFVVNFAEYIVQYFGSMTESLSAFSGAIGLVYPFSYGLLVAFATLGTPDYTSLGLSLAASLGYLALGAYAFRWLIRTIRKVGTGGVAAGRRETVTDTIIRPQIPWLGIIRKDLRIASRSPSFASLFFLPMIQTAILAVTFSQLSNSGLPLTLGVLTGTSMVILLLPTTMFSMEGLASAYTRSLPLKKKTLILAKTALSTLIYAISLVALFIIALYLGRDFTTVLGFGVIYAFSIAAACMLELIILVRKYWKDGFAMGNLYTRLSTFILVLIPAYIMAWTSIGSAFIVFFFAPDLVPIAFLAIALVEFAAMAAIVLRLK
jgi:hypothetical protein